MPSTFRALVAKTDVDTDSYRRVAHRIARRTVTRQVAAAPGSRARDVEPLPDPASVDPWDVDPATLPSTSAVVAICPRCDGEKKVDCPRCDGEGRVRCHGCWGLGKVKGKRGLKNCPTCRGRQTVKCTDCTKGRIQCPTCTGVGRVKAWLEVDTNIRVEIKVHPRSSLTSLHKRIDTYEDFDRDPASYRVPLEHDSGWADALPEPLPPELQATVDPVADRVIAQRAQSFHSDVFHMTYATRTSTGVVDVSGNPPGVLPSSDWWPLRRRLLGAVLAGIGLFIAAVMFHNAYVARHPWFHEHGSAGFIALLGLLAAVTTGLTLAEAWLPQPVRRGLRVKAGAGIIGAAWLGMFALWFVGGPTLEGVRASLGQDDLVAARQEADAMTAVGLSPEGMEDTLRALGEREQEAELARRRAADEAHLEQVRGASTFAGAVARQSERWWNEDMAEQARAVVLARADGKLDALYRATESAGLTELAGLVEPLDADMASRARAFALLARVSQCSKREDFACAVASLRDWQATSEPALMSAHEQVLAQTKSDLEQWLGGVSFDDTEPSTDLSARKRSLERAIDNAELYRDFAEQRPPVRVQALRRQLAKTERLIDRERRRAEAAERRRQAAEERAARRRAARERRRQRNAAPLLCRDGTYSPTCTCGGSRRGCCSHHGGVAGCSQ